MPVARSGVARRVANLWRCRGVARRSKIHEYSLSSRLAAPPNLQQRTRSLFKSWILITSLSMTSFAKNSPDRSPALVAAFRHRCSRRRGPPV